MTINAINLGWWNLITLIVQIMVCALAAQVVLGVILGALGFAFFLAVSMLGGLLAVAA